MESAGNEESSGGGTVHKEFLVRLGLVLVLKSNRLLNCGILGLDKSIVDVAVRMELGESPQTLLAAVVIDEEAPGPIKLSGRLEIAPALRDRLAADDTVFVFARSAQGGPPVAALRFRGGDLPLSFSF